MATSQQEMDRSSRWLVRWFLALELLVFGWVLGEVLGETGSLSVRLVRNVAAYSLVSLGLGAGLVLPLLPAARRWGRRRSARSVFAGVVVVLVLGPELILMLAHGSLPTRLPQSELRLVYGAGLTGFFLAGTVLYGVGDRLHWGRRMPGLRPLLAAVGLLLLTLVLGSVVMAARTSHAPADRGAVRRPNVVLVVVDALRSSALGAYGSTLGVSPHLDQLAGDGVLFESCFSVATTSVPGHAGILFGADVRRHLALTNAHDAPSSLTSLAQSLRERGYHTLGVCRNQLISRRAGFGAGFDFYWSSGRRALDEAPLAFVALSVAHAQIVGQLLDTDWVSLYARALLAGFGDARPTFLFLQFLQCHQPYRDGNHWATPENIERVHQAYREGVFTNRSSYGDEEVARFHAKYLGSVQYVDSLLGGLQAELAARGLTDDTVMIVTADHGENLAEHADSPVGAHGGYYDTSIRIPLVAAGPKLPAAWRSSVLTGHDRIGDLVLRLVDGRSSLTSVEVDSLVRKDSHFVYSDPYAMALDDSLKLVLDEVGLAAVDPTATVDPATSLPGEPLVFAWRRDRLDADPLARRDERVIDLWRNVVTSYDELRRRGALEPPPSLDPKRLEALRALGYVD